MSRLRPLFLVFASTALAIAVTPTVSQAATCADHDNQAAAQRAADTRDSDGDGIYCEALPCPCLKPGDGSSPTLPGSRQKRRAQTIRARITSVVDGDTIRVKSLEDAKRRFYTVRLIGIDTAETHGGVECGAKQATSHMLDLGFSDPQDTDGNGLCDTEGGEGRRVVLRTDPSQALFDRYDRLLAYATSRSGVNLGRRQIARGWSNVYVFDRPFAQQPSFEAAKRRAKRSNRGVWRLCGGDFHRPV